MDKYLVLVNKNNNFDPTILEDYEMVSVKDSDGKTYVEKETLKTFEKLIAVMKKRGIGLSITSAGRTIETQQKVFEQIKRLKGEEVAIKQVAMPGQSEHHTGLAFDVGVHKLLLPAEQAIYQSQLLTRIANKIKRPTKEEENAMYAVLHEELAECGFILRYPEDKKAITGVEVYEPWHIRYVGVEHAKAMQELGMCLEEYVAYLKEQENTVD